MGIFCQINLFKPSDGTFTAGSIVSGVLKYAVDQDTIFKQITVSLKGGARLVVRHQQTGGRGNGNNVQIYTNGEDYVDIDKIIHPIDISDKDSKVVIGTYETQFSFTLPNNIPSSFNYSSHMSNASIYCKIAYYIRIKFERPGFMKFDKKFKQEVNVVSTIIPRLPVLPTIFGEQKTLTQLFSSKKRIVYIKANIETCVIKPGGRIHLNYEIINDTNIDIKGVETKLIEVYNFTTYGSKTIEIAENVVDTDSKTGLVKNSSKQTMAIDIAVPSDKISLNHSKIVSRDYEINIKAILPFPHRNAVLKIPIQIGQEIVVKEVIVIEDPPPSYWQVMAEEAEDLERDEFFVNGKKS